MTTERITINRNHVWLSFDNVRIETENGIEEKEDQIVCYYKLTEPNEINYGTQLVDSNDVRLLYSSIDHAKQEVIAFLINDVYPPNYIHPLEYTKENLPEIMNKTLIFDVGTQNSDEIQESLVGVMTNCTLASNPPHLPGTARITLLDETERRFNFFQIKRIRRN
ncbi:hypothetical protein [Flavivirga sp. 57AJ16]|uniref:hypothetical protein n=1 Tax=Flavivirga sp. 57AJ16 TaxID=3025307 RepID=UPI0023665E11|nr:hypothetical protein [Flavivirga sp. 57AJ16]MDD7887963.1 hypothetical protein [Flavivirga sp. 57AJ16]